MQHHLYLIGFTLLGFITALLLFDLARLKPPFTSSWKPVVATLVLGFLLGHRPGNSPTRLSIAPRV